MTVFLYLYENILVPMMTSATTCLFCIYKTSKDRFYLIRGFIILLFLIISLLFVSVFMYIKNPGVA